jgi:hypothetical protein
MAETAWDEGAALDLAVARASEVRAVRNQALALTLGGALCYLALGRHRAGIALWSLALVVLAAGLLSSAARRRLARLGGLVQQAVGRTLAWALLTPVYFLIFTPAALVLRLRRRDPLHRRPLPPPQTYWWPRPHAPRPESYGRQFIFEERA